MYRHDFHQAGEESITAMRKQLKVERQNLKDMLKAEKEKLRVSRTGTGIIGWLSF
jgi:hypothetical protein